MQKLIGVLAALMLVLGLAIAEGDPPVDPTSDVPGIDCTLTWEGEQRTPGEMLKTLSERDSNHFQDEVDKWFESVGDLIQQKCDTAADSTE